MSAPLLTTKLYIPPPRSNVVPRAHLIARLDAALSRALTLIIAAMLLAKKQAARTVTTGDTLVTGPVIDQAALYDVLKHVRDVGLPSNLPAA